MDQYPSQKVALVLPNMAWGGKNNSIDWTIWPVSLCTFSSILEKCYNIKIIDANIDNLSEEAFEGMLRDFSPDVVGISVFCDDFADGGHAAARIAKKINPAVPVIMGGSYVTINHDVAIKDASIDFFVRGEGEHIIKRLIELALGRSEEDAIPGVIYRRPDGSIDPGLPPQPISDLDSIPNPDYTKIDFMKYGMVEGRNSPYAPPAFPYGRITTSRGCPFDCTFCQVAVVNGRGIRYRGIDSVISEIEMLLDVYGVKSVLIDDANFTINKKRSKAMIREFRRRNLKFEWKIMNLSVATLDEELLVLLKESGCNHIDLAIESGVPRVLRDLMRKPLKLDRVKLVIEQAKALEMQISANFIIGMPGETWEEIRQTIKFAEDIDIDYVKIMVAMPLRRTALHDQVVREGLVGEDFDIFNMRWGAGEISTDEFTSLDVSILRAYEWDRINFGSPEKIERVKRLIGADDATIKRIRRATRQNIHEAVGWGDNRRKAD